MHQKTVMSAIQPTGDLHLGNYFGAVQNWVHLQNQYTCRFGVVDYHAMTMPYQPAKLRENTWNMVFQLLACGVEPNNIFIQSLVPEHTELCWILSTVCAFGELQRMTQFKDKSDQIKSGDKEAFISTGLFFYPILQAADILIYRADYVPVGKDQEQHLELSRNIAQRFNNQFGKEYFVHPEPLFSETPKLLSTADPSRKMSKSLGPKHYIPMFGDLVAVTKQIRSAVTDTGQPTEGMSDGVKNLFTLLKLSGQAEVYAALSNDFNSGALKYSDLKQAVADGLTQMLTPVQDRMAHIKSDKKKVQDQIKASSADIRKVAQQTLREVKEITGLLNTRL
jgi:tryptophanyl-tRNA synthetase